MSETGFKNIRKIRAVYFSPAGHTQSVVKQIASALSEGLSAPVEEDDITLPSARKTVRRFTQTELAVFGFPTYAGRIPNKILPDLQTLFQGDNTPAVAVVTFGNRSYDESLKELCAELKLHGFSVCGGGAFVSAHVMSDVLANGRPDAEDEALIRSFSGEILRKLADADALPQAVRVSDTEEVGPYYRPLEEDGSPANFLKAKPVTDTSLCDRCGICARVCPMGSIDPGDITKTPGICIKCHACVRKCPVHAKSFDDTSLRSHIAMLEKTYARRAENAVFL